MSTKATAQVPDEKGCYGEFGRRFVPETLMQALEELTLEYKKAKADPNFQARLDYLLRTFVGRPNQICGGGILYVCNATDLVSP